MEPIDFFKMSGSGNDFIIIDNRNRVVDETHLSDFVTKVCRRKLSVGADGFILIENTDAADLSGLSYIKSDYQHRVLIGGRVTNGHGVGKINELGAEIAKDDSDKVIDAIRGTKRFYESDAFLLVAASAVAISPAILFP